jgi:hypothetical protein
VKRRDRWEGKGSLVALSPTFHDTASTAGGSSEQKEFASLGNNRTHPSHAKMPKSLVAEQSSWATASHTSSASTLASQRQLTPSPPSPPPRSRSKRERTPLEAYFHEQSKLFSHLEKRFAKFNARAADEKARARKERRRPAAPIKKFQKAPNQAASSLPPPIGPRPPSQPVVMIGPKAGTAVKSVIRQMGAVCGTVLLLLMN